MDYFSAVCDYQCAYLEKEFEAQTLQIWSTHEWIIFTKFKLQTPSLALYVGAYRVSLKYGNVLGEERFSTFLRL